jgi:TetR/AcrR family transcriptional regulator, ethionamide resistance regulator
VSHIFSGYSVSAMSNTFASRRSANRRRREEARQRILDATREFLQDKPFRDLTVDELMSATGLSRTGFYRYFPDREAVLLDLLEEVFGELADARDAEAVGADFDDSATMARLTEALTTNQGVLKAITDAAPGDEDLDRAYRAFMHSYWIDDITARIVEAQRHGLGAGLDPELAGEALGWMVERMVTQSLDKDPGAVLETLITIVRKCLYSDDANRQSGAPAGIGATPSVPAAAGEPPPVPRLGPQTDLEGELTTPL